MSEEKKIFNVMVCGTRMLKKGEGIYYQILVL